MNSKILLIGWVKTLICSFIASFLFGLGFAYLEMHGHDVSHTVGLIAWGALYLNAVLFIMSMLSLFLTVPNFYQNLLMRYVLYFGGCIMFVVALLFANIKDLDRAFYLLVSAIYLLVSIFFYRKLVKASGGLVNRV